MVDMRFDLLFRFLEMKKDLEEEQRKSAMSRIQSQALTIVLDKRERRIEQLGSLSSKICETIKQERMEMRRLQLKYCPELLETEEQVSESEDSDEKDRSERAKMFEDDEEEGGVKLYVQNTIYKQVVMNVKDLTNICEVTTDSEAEQELTSLDSDETKKKKNKMKNLSKKQSKPDMPDQPVQPQPSKTKKKKKKKKKHNDSLSDDDPVVAAPVAQLQRITLTEADVDTLTADFDATHADMLRRALEDLMRAQGLLSGDTRREGAHPYRAGDQSGAADGNDCSRDSRVGTNNSDSSELPREQPCDLDIVLDERCETAATDTDAGHSKKKKNKKEKHLYPSFDVNDVD